MSEEPAQEPQEGVVENVALLDLSTMKSREELAGIKSIRNVANIIVPESLPAALATIPMRNVAKALGSTPTSAP